VLKVSREIKFRFWDIVDNDWMIDGREETNIYDFAFNKGMNWQFITKEEALERVVVMQYTGLNDKNGNPIYEGDIAKLILQGSCSEFPTEEELEETIYIGEVFYNNGFHVKCENHSPSITSYVKKSIEVIGNKFENPELLL
jgi:uncharacterized phage protein (TIGR01671 family)